MADKKKTPTQKTAETKSAMDALAQAMNQIAGQKKPVPPPTATIGVRG
jgi:hypothetical protein